MGTLRRMSRDVCLGLLMFWGIGFLAVYIKNNMLDILGLLCFVLGIAMIYVVVSWDNISSKTKKKISFVFNVMERVLGRIKNKLGEAIANFLEWILEFLPWLALGYFLWDILL